MKSIRWKLVFMYIALVFIVMLIGGMFMVLVLRERTKQTAYAELRDYAKIILDEVVETICPKDTDTEEFAFTGEVLDAFQEALSSYKRSDALIECSIIRLASYNYKTIASTTAAAGAQSMYPQISTRVVIAAAAGSEGFEYNRSLEDFNSELSKPYYEYAVPYSTYDGDIRLIVYARRDATDSNDNLSQITSIFAGSVIIAMFFTAILGVVFSSSLTVPLSKLSHTANELAEGNLDLRAEVTTKDEIGRLNASFNYMAAQIARNMREIESEKSKLEALINNMTDGVLAYDDNGSLIHANDICEELLEIDNIKELSFLDILNALNLNAENGLPQGAQSGVTVVIGEKYINASFNAYGGADERHEGVVVVLQDVTKQMKLDNMRKEFVANVSHEFRTPLTNIKSYAETLEDIVSEIGGEMAEKREEFLKIIVSEADRMTFIASDLLELSRFDNKQYDLNMVETDLRDVITRVVKQNAVAAERQGKKIIFEMFPREIAVKIDADRINQVFNNIISNSLKYGGDAVTVNIWAVESPSRYTVYIKDDGPGIPKDDARRIFERFYRVDKARSRELGGTGLGLSIAKEIMEAHNGKITCSGELGRGTTMILTFDKVGDET